jgi:hypothetical protein
MEDLIASETTTSGPAALRQLQIGTLLLAYPSEDLCETRRRSRN